MSGINIAGITSKTLLGATFAQAVYPNKNGAPFNPPVGFVKVDTPNFTPTPTATSSIAGFAAQAYVNVQTGELVIAYRGSDNPAEAALAATWAGTGSWNAQFTDATNYAAAARTAALAKVNEYRIKPENGLQPLTQLPDDKILVAGHSLGGLLSQVVSKMFGWSAQVYDSLGGGKLVYSTDPATGKQVFSAGFTEQANKLGLTVGGKVVDHDVSGKIQNWGTSNASDVGVQLGTHVDIPALGQMGGGTRKNGVRSQFIPRQVMHALQSIDRDGNGVIDMDSELFNAPNTPFDQRGWTSLKYYDSNQDGNNDGQITQVDPLWKLLRIWVVINGDGAVARWKPSRWTWR